MRVLVVSAMAFGVLFAGCASAGSTPVSSVAVTPPPVAAVTPAPSTATPSPSVASTPPPSVEPSPMPKGVAESTLLAGIRKDAKVDCSPQRSSLPQAAIAGIECHPRPDLMTSVGFYVFASQADLLSTYFALLAAHGVAPRSGDCVSKTGVEDAYQPGDGTDGIIAAREGCFVASGKASYLSTQPANRRRRLHVRRPVRPGGDPWCVGRRLQAPRVCLARQQGGARRADRLVGP